MNIPGYDAWRLQGPEERPDPIMEECETCHGHGVIHFGVGMCQCEECKGMGEVEVAPDEPDGDYEYERRRDAKWEAEE